MIIKVIVNLMVFVGSSLLLFYASLWDVNWLDYESPIKHEKYKDITLKNFRGLNRTNNTIDGMKEFAFIVTEMKVLKKENKYHIVSLFHPSRSYTFSTEFETDDKLLSHEIYHFHITEYCSRLFRKELESVQRIDESKIQRLQKHYSEVEDAMQLLYDHETYHGYVLGKQLSWQKEVDSLLNSVVKYKETEINN